MKDNGQEMLLQDILLLKEVLLIIVLINYLLWISNINFERDCQEVPSKFNCHQTLFEDTIQWKNKKYSKSKIQTQEAMNRLFDYI